VARKSLQQTQKKSVAGSWRNPAGAASAVLLAATAVIPIIISPSGEDAFRLPKELAFRAVASLLIVAGAFAATAPNIDWAKIRLARREIVLAGLILFWTAATTLTSTNRSLSAWSFVTVVASVIIFLASLFASASVPVLWVDLLLIAASINSVFVSLQEFGVWNPFAFPPDLEPHMKSSAFIGNPNDVGAYLVVPGLAAVVAAVAAVNRRRWFYVLLALVIGGGLIASGTRTALMAYAAGLIVFALVRRPRHTAIALAVFTVIAIGLVVSRPGSRSAVRSVRDMVAQRRFDILLSDRLPAFLSAWEMARSHPLVGVGPGCFKYNYMEYRIALQSKYPPEWVRGRYHQNFAEVHNDHLQVLAETGIPGYCLLLASVLVLAGLDRRSRQESEGNRNLKEAFARDLRLPLACVFFLLAMAQFPLEVAAPRFVFLTAAGLCIGWQRDA